MNVVTNRSFHDHHPFNQEDCRELIEQSTRDDVQLITTEKDAMRLRNMGGAQEALLRMTATLPIELKFENPRQVENLITRAIDKSR